MSLIQALEVGIEKITGIMEISEMLSVFEGQAVSFTISDGEVFTFTCKAGVLQLQNGQLPGVKGAAITTRENFVSFINGKRDFPGLFTHEFPHYFTPTVGEYYDFGGDFMLMAPVFDGLSRVYKTSSVFRECIEMA